MKPTTEVQLRRALSAYATEISATHSAPPASILWLRARHQAQRNARRQALARATLPLRIMQIVGILFALTACAWCLHQSHAGTAALPPSLLLCAAAATLMVIIGSWFLLRSDRTRPLTTNH